MGKVVDPGLVDPLGSCPVDGNIPVDPGLADPLRSCPVDGNIPVDPGLAERERWERWERLVGKVSGN